MIRSCLAFIALLLVFSLAIAPGQAQGGCTVQSTPYFTEYYGDVHLDGADAPFGTLVEAFSPSGVRAGCLTVSIPGVYGCMRVYGADVFTGIPGMADNEAVMFKVNGAVASSVPTPVLWTNDKAQHEVHLAAASLPNAVTDLRISIVNSQPVLAWSDVGGGVERYEVWRSAKPYFAPGEMGAEKIAPSVAPVPGGSVSYPDTTSHLGVTGVEDYYLVLAVKNGQASLLSSRVGAFDMGLSPPGPGG